MSSSLRGASRRLRSRPLGSLLTLTMLAAVLLVAATAATVLFNVQQYVVDLQRQVGLVAYLQEDAPAGRLEELARTVEQLPGIQEVRPVPRELAMADLRTSLGSDAQLLEDLGPELLPDALEIVPGQAGSLADGLEALRGRVASMGGVASVSRAGSSLDGVVRLRALLDVLRVGGLLLLMLMLGLAGWLVGGMVALGVLARKKEMQLMRLLGASRWFMLRPFMTEGLLLGSCAALLSMVGLLGVVGALRAALGLDAAILGIKVQLPPLWAGGVFLLAAGLVGLIGAAIAGGRAAGR